MATAFKIDLEPFPHHGKGQIRLESPSAQCQYVGLVVPAAEANRVQIVANGRPYAGNLVGRDSHADPGAADEDAALGVARRDPLSHGCSEIGVVNALVRVGALVGDLMIIGFEHTLDPVFEGDSSVIGANPDLHTRRSGKWMVAHLT